jgi:hypothetical protein
LLIVKLVEKMYDLCGRNGVDMDLVSMKLVGSWTFQDGGRRNILEYRKASRNI